MSKNVNYDFAGWVTKHDTRCTDGVTIKHDAFKDNDGQKVPLVWNHDYNTPNNVLGHVSLKHRAEGVYGYGFFNDTVDAQNAKELVRHGDISSMSIGARKIKRQGSNVIHGLIYEVSLVMAGANPGATIESFVTHSDEGDVESGIIYTGTLIHSSDDVLFDDSPDAEPEKEEAVSEEDIPKSEEDIPKSEEILNHAKGENTEMAEEKTVGDILETLTEEQAAAVQVLLETVVDEYENDEDEEGDEEVKQNVFSKNEVEMVNDTLRHSAVDALEFAMKNGASSLKQVMEADEVLQHGINSIEMLFPEAAYSTNGNEPIIYKDPNTAYKEILNSVSKSPFSRVRTLVADLTEAEARAKGYITGNLKKEEFFSLIKRSTTPTTVYKKQKIDRDDLVDITDFNVVAFMNREMRMMLEEEIARAVLVGDGRDVSAEDKINEMNLRPIISDHEFFTIHKAYTSAATFTEDFITAMADYRGSGAPTMFIDPVLLASIRLLKATDGRYLFGDIPSVDAIASKFGVSKIVPTTFMSGKGALAVNLRDYTLGSTNGGQITNFDDFDIDFNQYKYLIETRLSGALTMPKSAIHMVVTTAGTGADDEAAGMVWGTRTTTTTTAAPTSTTTSTTTEA